MSNQSNDSTYTLLRGGQKMYLHKKKDYISLRTKRGAKTETLTRSLDCQVSEYIQQQNLTVMSVNPTKTDQFLSEMKASNEVAFAANVFAMENDPGGEIFLTDELTVQFKADVPIARVDELAKKYAINFVKEVKGMLDCYVFRIVETNPQDAIEITNQLMTELEVAWCEPNVVVKTQNYYTPSDALFEQQWHLFHEGGIQLAEGSHVDATKAWDITRGDRSIVVAVADDSVDLSHRDLQGLGKIVAPRDFQGLDFDPNPERQEENHGTAVAGVAIAEDNGFGVVGIAPGCGLMPIRTSGFLDDNSIEALFEWVEENGAAVMCNSWGPSAINFPLSVRQTNAIARAAQNGRKGKGVMIFFAAGNSNRPVNGIVNETGWPEDQLEGPVQWLDGFATHPDVIAVAASTSLGEKSFYSSWGREISVCAPSNNGHPGIGFSPTFPFVRTPLQGRGIVTTDRVGPVGYDSSDFTDNFGGTSSACPLAAGVGALILSANPNLTAKEARVILESTTDKITDDSVDPQLGNAFGNYNDEGHSLWFGYGKVNAFKAVKAAVEGLGEPDPDTDSIVVRVQPDLEIPDNNAEGLESIISIEPSGLLASIAVSLRLTHTYIGDLVVSLESPSGNTILLHNRTGGSGNDIIQTYNLDSTPALAQLIRENIRGDWRLKVQDLARLDVGTLNEWGLVLETAGTTLASIGEEPGVTIPDADPAGVIRSLAYEGNGIIRKLEVTLDISHTYIADLVVTLKSPNGTSILLHNRSGGSADNISRKYGIANFSDLNAFVGASAQGIWTLQVQDLAFRDTGKINAWGIAFEFEKAPSA